MQKKVIIIEDEKPAALKLKNDLLQHFPDMEVLKLIHDVNNSIKWLKTHLPPDLIFMDIELTDGLSFEIFDAVEVNSPIIFTTAYDEYWQQALSHNGIDYLLKPIQSDKLKQAVEKYDQIRWQVMGQIRELIKNINQGDSKTLQDTFLIKRGNELVRVDAEEIAYIYASEKVTCLVTQDQTKLIIDQSLAVLEKQLNPDSFLRVNRKFILHQSCIQKIHLWPKGRLRIEVIPPIENDLIISAENVGRFKTWLEGKA